MKTRSQFVFTSELIFVIALAILFTMTSPLLLAAQSTPSEQQNVQKPLVLVFTATFAPKVGDGPSLQYDFQAESLLRATSAAQDWAKEYCPQNVLVSLVPKLVVPKETYSAIFQPKVGAGPTLLYEFQVAVPPSAQYGIQTDRFLLAIRSVLDWGWEYWPQHVLVTFVPKSQAQETNAPVVVDSTIRGNSVPPGAPLVFTASFLSRDTGLVIQQEVRATSFLRAVRQTVAWSKQHCPEHVMFSLVQH